MSKPARNTFLQVINTAHEDTVAISQQNTVAETTVPSGAPSFPAVPHSLSTLNSLVAVNQPAFDTSEKAVRDTVDSIVSNVANENH